MVNSAHSMNGVVNSAHSRPMNGVVNSAHRLDGVVNSAHVRNMMVNSVLVIRDW